MIVEQKIQAILETVSGCTFYEDGPDSCIAATTPIFGTFTKVGGEDFNNLEGDIDTSRPRIQISLYAINRGDRAVYELAVSAAMKTANTLANNAVDAGLDAFTTVGALPNISVSVPVHGRDPETRRFLSHMDFYCWCRE